ncbi:MAG: DEAD/DEAH box helicase family protein [Eubacterium sp.]|nr:DEAD/DEAH box helicase family protein [Eubacterium sp.]
MQLKEFQLNAVKELFEAMEKPSRDIILKSPTGSGKTIILTYFMHQYIQSFSKTVFVWLTPGKASLEEQSKEKMDKYIHASKTKLLADVMTSGFEENDCCFINWEKLTKKGNTALRDSERTNFLEHIQNALNNGINFKIIVDESHQNNTIKADEIIKYFKTDKIIRCSATPKGYTKAATVIEIPESEVIAAGLIKKLIVINENFPQVVSTDSQINYLLDKAVKKQRQLHSAFLGLKADINPLIVVQIPNKSETLQEEVERYFESQGMNYENGQLAVWMSKQHENLEEIEKIDSPVSAVIIKQAVATGWDCPRAQILVKLRDNMDETFEIQTIGRIRRMPEAKHYESDLLDSCYLYTFDDKFTAGVKNSLGSGALEATTIFLKNEYKNISLISEQRTMVSTTRNPKKALTAIAAYIKSEFNLSGNMADNKKKLEANGFLFGENIYRNFKTGQMITLSDDLKNLNENFVIENLDTHKHGRDYHQKIGKIGMEIGIEYSFMNTIMRKLVDKKFSYSNKILALGTREVYSFVINNADRLRHIVREALAADIAQTTLKMQQKSEFEWHIPQSFLFTYDSAAKSQAVMDKNVYEGYLTSAEKRSASERKFEKFCQRNPKIEWFYKNGDKGNEYFSIVYTDNSDKQKLFYPDYLIGYNGEIWIIETKGGFDRYGNSEDIDIYTAKKFGYLKQYLDAHNLKGGIVRNDSQSDELCICMDNYNDDISSDSWQILEDVFCN